VNGSPLYEVIWLGDLPLGVMKQTKTGNLVSTRLDDIYADHLNAPRVITRGSDQAILWRWESTEPFGATPANDNPSALGTYPFNLRLPGQVFDKETGWAYNQHRDYDPYLGRYIQSDPIGLKGGINTYGYVGGDPISDVDPEGLMGNASGASRSQFVPKVTTSNGPAGACYLACRTAALVPSSAFSNTTSLVGGAMCAAGGSVAGPEGTAGGYAVGRVLGQVGGMAVGGMVSHLVCSARCAAP
jgi:RHS repeat-associated protein